MQNAAIMSAAWLKALVEDGNLAVEVSAIRLALAGVRGGENWIEALARPGYRFEPDPRSEMSSIR